MKTAKFTYWQDGEHFLGFLNEYPDYQTQGISQEELVSNLRDLRLTSSRVRCFLSEKSKTWLWMDEKTGSHPTFFAFSA
jgi:hypothetical protein